MSGRRERKPASGGANKSTLQALSAARKRKDEDDASRVKRTDQFEVKKVEDALIDVDDIQDEKLKKKISQRDTGFIVDEYGFDIPVDLDDINADLGDNYGDDEEDNSPTLKSSKKRPVQKKSAQPKSASTSTSRKRKVQASPENNPRLLRSLLSPGATSSSKTSNSASATPSKLTSATSTNSSNGDNDIFSSLINSLHENPYDEKLKPGRTPTKPAASTTKKPTFSFFDEAEEPVDEQIAPVVKTENKETAPAPETKASTTKPAASTSNDDMLVDDDDDYADLIAASEAVEKQLLEQKSPQKSPPSKKIKMNNQKAVFVPRQKLNLDEEEIAAKSTNLMTGLTDCLANKSTLKINNSAIEAPTSSKGTIEFYFLDASEEKAMPGCVFMFGKAWSATAKAYQSCCIVVKGIERQLLVYRRDGYQNSDVQNEFNTEIRKRFTISQLKTKVVKRNYAWDHTLYANEQEAEKAGKPKIGEDTWVKVRYPYKDADISEDIVRKGGNTFSCILGASTPALELFLLKRKIMGPCWITVQIDQATNDRGPVSWCKQEFHVPFTSLKVNNNQSVASPPLVAMSISVCQCYPPNKNAPEIAMISGTVHPSMSLDIVNDLNNAGAGLPNFTLLRKVDPASFPLDFEQSLQKKRLERIVSVENNEKVILEKFIAKIEEYDPDLIVGHEVISFDMDILLRRMQRYSISQWSKIGRLNRQNMPKISPHSLTAASGRGKTEVTLPSWFQKSVVAGRLVCDTAVCSRELIREKSYALSELAKTQLGILRDAIEVDDVEQYFRTSSTALIYLVEHCKRDTLLSIKLMNKLMALSLYKQLTAISGNLLSRSLMGGRAERIEYLLLHQFHNDKFVLPDKADRKTNEAILNAAAAAKFAPNNENDSGNANKSTASKKKPKYDGGLVLDPIVGLHEKYVLLLDFVSLYPSIIREFNVCFTTFAREKRVDDLGNIQLKITDKPGVVPTLVGSLVDRRRSVKVMLQNAGNDELKKQQLDIKQRALKLTANSLYGCLGYANSRFFCLPLAEFITRQGRTNLKETKSFVEGKGAQTLNQNFTVVYGDTDSIMVKVKTDTYDEALALGHKLKTEINKKHKMMEIEVECVFKALLLRSKKKYAALKLMPSKPGSPPVEIKETKGLDLVRRDWCDISKEIGHSVLDQILSGHAQEDVIDAISTRLREFSTNIREGKIPIEKFIIMKGLSKNPEDYPDAKNQAHVQVALKMKTLGRNVKPGDYIPYVICTDNGEEGTAATFAERAFPPDMVKQSNGKLKLDTNWYFAQQIHPPVYRLCESIEGIDAGFIADALGMDSTKYQAPVSRSVDTFTFATEDREESFVGVELLEFRCPGCKNQALFSDLKKNNMDCQSCSAPVKAAFLCNQVTLSVRKHVDKFYESWTRCDDCCNRTRQPQSRARCLLEGCHGTVHLEVTPQQLYNQLRYYKQVLGGTEQVCSLAAKKIDAVIKDSDFGQVDLKYLFRCFTSVQIAPKAPGLRA